MKQDTIKQKLEKTYDAKKYLILKKGFFLVKGKVNGLLFDSLSGKLFHLKNNALKVIKQIEEHSIRIQDLIANNKSINSSNDYIETIDDLFSSGLVEIVGNKRKRLRLQDFTFESYGFKKLAIALNNICNQRCKHCYFYKFSEVDTKFKEFKLNLVKNLIDQLQYFGFGGLNILGGEPFLSKKLLFEVIKMAYNYTTIREICIFTNCMFFDEQFIKQIEKYKDKVTFHFVLHSYDKNTHDDISQAKGSFEKTINAIELCKRYKFMYYLQSIISKYNYDNLKENNVSFFTKLKDPRQTIRIFTMAKDYSSDSDLLHDLSSEYFDRKFYFNPFTFFKNVKVSFEDILLNMNYSSCFKNNLYVNVDGELFFCAEYPTKEECIGNVLETPIKDLIENKQYFNIKKKPLFKEEKCSLCEFRFLCHRCKSYLYYCNMNYITHWCLYDPETGDIGKKNERN